MDDHEAERPIPAPPQPEGEHERRELVNKDHSNMWKDLLANPLTIAIVGGIITLLTTIATNFYTARANREADAARAQLARESAQETLQADLIKKFVESPSKDTVRENLRFLVDAGLLPTYADSIKKYLSANPGVAPQLGDKLEFSTTGETVSEGLKERIRGTVSRFRAFLQARGFSDLDDPLSVFIYSKDLPPPAQYDTPGENRNSFYVDNTLFIHKDLSEDVSVALREFTHYALLKAVGSPRSYKQTEVESALADYLPATFLNLSVFGSNLRKNIGLPSPFFRNIDNAKSYDAVPTDWFSRGIVWAGALWACRQRTGRGVDDLILPVWREAMVEPDQEHLIAQRFGTALTLAAPPFGQCFSEEMSRRNLPRSNL